MKEIFSAVARELKKDASTDEVTALIRKHITRRQFLVGSSAIGLGVATFSILGCGSSGAAGASEPPRQVFVADALGMVVADSTLCVGCRRCEAACVAYNQGVVQPSISNVKVSRNQQFGVAGVTATGFQRGDGDFGNFRTVQDTCRQCAHPVPCQLACPHDAIEVIAPVNARVVNIAKCVGCGICLQACPWAMTSLSGPINAKNTKSNKCHLCNGNPECVQACPSGALKYTAWADRTKIIPARQVVPASIESAVQGTCVQCH
jgi:Fe-S-cluster-containing dehydrogenase component